MEKDLIVEELTSELAATKKTLGTLITWLQVDLGEENVKRLLDMMCPQMNADTPPNPK